MKPFGIVLLIILLIMAAAMPGFAADPDYTFVLVPDPQYMTIANGWLYQNMLQWCLDNKVAWNIKGVIGLGDLTQTAWDGTGTYTFTQEYYGTTNWQNTLDAATPPMPWISPPGNHDYNPNGNISPRVLGAAWQDANAATGAPIPGYYSSAHKLAQGVAWWSNLGQFFPADGKARNSYIRLTTSMIGLTRNILILALDFYPSSASANWALGVLAAFPNDDVIVTTHSFLAPQLNAGDTVFPYRLLYADDPNSYGLTNAGCPANCAALDAPGMWNTLLAPSRNVIAIVNGHAITVGLTPNNLPNMTWRRDAAADGHNIIQMFANWQAVDQANVSTATLGSTHAAYLVLWKFRPANNTLEQYVVCTNCSASERYVTALGSAGTLETYAAAAVSVGTLPYTATPRLPQNSAVTGTAAISGKSILQ